MKADQPDTGKREGSMLAHDPLADLDSGGPFPGGDLGRVELGDTLTIPDVTELQDRLRAALDLGPVTLAAGELEQVDCAGLQLLCALFRTARNEARPVQWDGVSSALRQAAAQLGLAGELALED
jgi:ABC-type transporter Mla MlaB component